MWKGIMTLPRGRISSRKLMTCATALLVACFAYGLTQSTPVEAVQATPQNQTNNQAPGQNSNDIQWENGTLTYKGLSYEGPQTATQDNELSLPENATYYTAHEDANGNQSTVKGYIIYFEPGVDMASVDKAKFITADYNVASGEFTNLATATTVSVDTSTYSPSLEEPETSCAVESIGWLVCPISNWIAEGMDAIYTLIEGYLVFQPISYGNNAVYKMWEVVRNIANVLFVIGFLMLIYAQITGAVMSNYTIKKMLPRLVIAAVLVNISFWICAVAVDLSNILGASVQDLFVNMQSSVGGAAVDKISWQSVTIAVLGGTGLAIAGGLAVMGVGVGAAALMLVAALIPAIFAIFVAIVILAARQALIMLLIVIAPLAFVAYLLPNTEEWFNRWRKFFTTLLVFFPVFGVLFGASQLAGTLIIQTAPNIPVVILGLVVQVVPLFITPFLIKLSSGVLGTVAGLANDRSKGVFDRTQNWAKGNAEYLKSNRMRKNAQNWDRNLKKRREAKGWRRAVSMGGMAYNGSRMAGSSFVDRGERRKQLTEANMQSYRALAQKDTRGGQKVFARKGVAAAHQQEMESVNQERFNQLLLHDKSLVGKDNKMLSRPFRDNHGSRAAQDLRGSVHEYHRAHEAAADLKKKIDEEGSQHYRESLVNAKKGSYEEKLRKINQETVVHQKRAETAKNIIQKAGEANYHDLTMGNEHVQNIRLRSERADKDALAAEGKVKQMLADVQIKGSGADGLLVSQANINVADGMLKIREQSAIAQGRLKATESIIEQQDAAFWDNALLDKSAPMHDKVLQTRIQQEAASKQAELAAEQSKEFFTNMRFVQDKALSEEDRAILTQTLVKDENNTIVPASISLGDLAKDIGRSSLDKQLVSTAIKQTEINESDAYATMLRGESLEDNPTDEQQAQAKEFGDELRKRAAGINKEGKHSTFGEGRVLGQARAEKSKRLGENIEAQKAIYSETTLGGLLSIVDAAEKGDKILLPGAKEPRIPSFEERAAAEYAIITQKGNHEAVLQSWENANIRHGMAYDDKEGRHYIPARDKETGDVIFDDDGKPMRDATKPNDGWLSSREAEERSDMQQIILDAYQKGSRKIESFSGTERGLMAAGLSIYNMRDSMLNEWGYGKVEVGNLRDANIDEYKEWMRAVRDPKWREKLDERNPEAREAMLKKIELAQHSGDLEDRVFIAMSAMANYLEADESVNGNASDAATRERIRKEMETKIRYITKVDSHSGKKIKVRLPSTSTLRAGDTYQDPDTGKSWPVSEIDPKAIKRIGDTRSFGLGKNPSSPYPPNP